MIRLQTPAPAPLLGQLPHAPLGILYVFTLSTTVEVSTERQALPLYSNHRVYDH